MANLNDIDETNVFGDVGVEILLYKPDDFLKIKETLSRIGIASFQEKILWQSCNILHKRGYYAILHFKELFKLDNKPSSLTDIDTNTLKKIMGEIRKVIPVGFNKHKEKQDEKLMPLGINTPEKALEFGIFNGEPEKKFIGYFNNK